MFTSLKSIIPSKIDKFGIKKQIQVIDICKKSEDIINFKIKSKFKASVVKYKNQTIFIKTNNYHLLNEIKMMEDILKEEFQKNKLNIKYIKYLI